MQPFKSKREEITIVPVKGRRALRQFIRLPWSIYADDPIWVPPLLWERQQYLSLCNPYFAHARWQAWLAFQGARPVGRISAQFDHLHLEYHQDNAGFFGLLEAENNPAIFSSLLSCAETWLREQGLRRILGPFNLSINSECGLLVDGFETPPAIMMGHAPPYYATKIQEQGYTKARDLLAYRIKPNFSVPAAMQALTAKAGGKVHLRTLRRSQLDTDLATLRDIFNDAWSQNWNFIPFTEAEFTHLGRDLTWFVSDDFIQIAEVDGNPAAMIVLLPNLNEIIRDLNGRLLPSGWIKLFWRLKWDHPKTARVPLMGIRKHYQKTLLGTALAFKLIDALRAPAISYGIKEVELSWILEDNLRMRKIIESIDGRVYKRYRIYQKDLA